MKSSHHSGFTLLELSIVLVIIGLIIGGITVGQDLIRAAELNNVITDVNRYKVAVNTFKLKYNALPGDMSNASDYWPSCVDDTNETINTCNGNGNGKLATNGSETFRVWQHLSLSGIISGTYTGLTGTSGEYLLPGVNVPNAALRNGVYGVGGNVSGGTGGDTIAYALSLGQIDDDDPENGNASEAIFSPTDAYNLDQKFDDGHPIQGSVFGFSGINFPPFWS